MIYLFISLIGFLLGFWAIYRLLTIHPTPVRLRPMTEAEYQEQRISFAYGNGVIDNPLISKDMVREAAKSRGIVLSSNMVGTSYRTQHPNFWTEDEP